MKKTKTKIVAKVKVGGKLAHLSVARQALAAAELVPDIRKLVDYAEAVRVAARASQQSVPGINAWTRFKLDAERKGDRKIAQLRKAGKLAEKGRPKNLRSAGVLLLPDLLGKRAYQRSSDWNKLGLLEERELDRLEKEANEAGKLLAERALIKLGAATITAAKRAASRAAPELPDGVEMRIGDCREVFRDVPDSSVPLILTDPAYGDDAELLYQWLAEFAARVLIPGGSLICYTGQSRLDRDMAIFSAQLRYWWLLVMPHKQSQRLPGKFVIANFKPVLWYVKESRRGRSLMPDMLNSPAREKELHNWAQGEAGVSQIIEHLSEPGELIVDPFAGTGQWGKIAAKMGRRWLGADLQQGGTETIYTAAE
jgi:hypothetical protein